MDVLREFLTRDSALALGVGGLVLGFLFGAIVFRTNYCAMGSLSDIFNFGDWRRFRAWILAATTALIGAQLLQWAGIVALDKSMYLTPSLSWVGHIVGGLIFGFGMVFAGGCPSRNLSRAGGGDLRALVTLIVLGLFAYMTIGGIFAPLRAAIERATTSALPAPTQGLGALLGFYGWGSAFVALFLACDPTDRHRCDARDPAPVVGCAGGSQRPPARARRGTGLPRHRRADLRAGAGRADLDRRPARGRPDRPGGQHGPVAEGRGPGRPLQHLARRRRGEAHRKHRPHRPVKKLSERGGKKPPPDP